MCATYARPRSFQQVRASSTLREIRNLLSPLYLQLTRGRRPVWRGDQPSDAFAQTLLVPNGRLEQSEAKTLSGEPTNEIHPVRHDMVYLLYGMV